MFYYKEQEIMDKVEYHCNTKFWIITMRVHNYGPISNNLHMWLWHYMITQQLWSSKSVAFSERCSFLHLSGTGYSFKVLVLATFYQGGGLLRERVVNGKEDVAEINHQTKSIIFSLEKAKLNKKLYRKGILSFCMYYTLTWFGK